MILHSTRHAGLVPASAEPQATTLEARQTPAQGRGDGVLLGVEAQQLLGFSIEGCVG